MFKTQRCLETVVTVFGISLTVLYASTILHLWENAPNQLRQVEIVLNTFVALTLLYFFNPLRKKRSITAFEKRMVFMGSLIILINTSIFQFIKRAQSDVITSIRDRVASRQSPALVNKGVVKPRQRDGGLMRDERERAQYVGAPQTP